MKQWLAHQFTSFLELRSYKISKQVFHQEHEIDLRLLLAERIERQKGGISVVQIGANDGVTNDPINHLIKSRGWSLLAVEPLEAPFNRLRENYHSTSKVECRGLLIEAGYLRLVVKGDIVAAHESILG